MGWDFSELGLNVVFSRRIPEIVRKLIRSNIRSLLENNGIGLEDLTHFVVHPGGTKILDALQEELELGPSALQHSRCVLRDYGNLSAPTVFFVLDHLVRENSVRKGDYGLLAAFGPGFSSELILLRW